MKKIITYAITFIFSASAFAQSIDQVLVNGEVINRGEKVLLRLSKDTMLEYDVLKGKKKDPVDFKRYPDQVHYFLVKGSAVNIYMRPLNPLSMSVNGSFIFRTDSLTANANAALAGITDLLRGIMTSGVTSKGGGAKADMVANPCEPGAEALINELEKIETALVNKNREQILSIFKDLKDCRFADESSTFEIINSSAPKLKRLDSVYNAIVSRVTALRKHTGEFTCTSNVVFSKMLTQTIKSALNAVDQELLVQQKRLAMVNAAFAAVTAKAKEARQTPLEDNTLGWLVKVSEVPVKEGSVSEFKMVISKGGYEIRNNEISESGTVTISAQTLYFRRFNRFVPEVAAGIVYSKVAYQKYGVATDNLGVNRVADGGKHNVSAFSVTSMVNFNYYTPNTLIHPFLQLGVGTSTDYQSLLMGAGIRIKGLHAMSFSVGGTSPVQKQLRTLTLNSVVSGTADLEKDYYTTIKWFQRVYIGVQVKL